MAVFRTGGFAVAWLNLPNPMDGLNCDLSMAWWNWNRIENHCVVTDPECPWNWTKIHVQTSKEVNRLWLVVFFIAFHLFYKRNNTNKQFQLFANCWVDALFPSALIYFLHGPEALCTIAKLPDAYEWMQNNEQVHNICCTFI